MTEDENEEIERMVLKHLNRLNYLKDVHLYVKLVAVICMLDICSDCERGTRITSTWFLTRTTTADDGKC